MAESVSKNCKLSPGDIVEFTDTDTLQHGFSGNIKPQKIPLKILYEDDYYLIISKDAGISVHPSPGRYENTLVNALLFYFKNHSKNFSYFMDSVNDTAIQNHGYQTALMTAVWMIACTEDMDSRTAAPGQRTKLAVVTWMSAAAGTDGMYSGQYAPGIIHRLDKDTSGLIIVAKDSNSQYRMAELFKNRQVEKTYLALVAGGFSEKKGKI